MRGKSSDLIMDYITNLYASKNPGMDSILKRLEEQGQLGINIGIVEARLIQILIRLSQAKKIVECGTLFGYSTVCMAQAVEKGAQIYTIEKNLEAANQARKSFKDCGVEDKITLLVGEVDEKLGELSNLAPFDMIFIDHNKAGYLSALKWAEQNIRKGGLIIADNTLLFGHVVSDQSQGPKVSSAQREGMRNFNLELSNPKKFTSILLPTSEGLSIALNGSSDAC